MLSTCNSPIGIFDSGVGGISVLCAAKKILPKEDYIYYADSAYAPYGTQTVDAVVSHSLRVTKLLLEYKIKALVVACNTATSAAINKLRYTLPIPVIGMEPALKPAVVNHNSRKIIVMATPMTIKNNKFQRLLAKYADTASIISLPAPRLVELVESGDYNSTETKHYLIDLLATYKEDISAIVLGCTHYLFIRNLIAEILGPQVALIDGNSGTIRQLERILTTYSLLNDNGGQVTMLSSGNEKALALCNQLYHYGLNNLTFYNSNLNDTRNI